MTDQKPEPTKNSHHAHGCPVCEARAEAERFRYASSSQAVAWKERAEKAEAQVQELRAVLEDAAEVARSRPHDGSQLDADLEDLLLSIKALLARIPDGYATEVQAYRLGKLAGEPFFSIPPAKADK